MPTLVKEQADARGESFQPSHLTIAQWFAETLIRWRLIAAVLGATVLAGALAAVFIPPVYRSRASFVANMSSGSKLPAGLASGPLAGLATQLGSATGADPSESPNFYAQLVESRELLTRLLLSRFANPRSASRADSATLLEILRIRGSDPRRKLEKAIKKISKAITTNYDIQTNLVVMEFDSRWPDLSAAIGNRTVDLVAQFNAEQRVEKFRGKRVFLEGRVQAARTELDGAEARLRQFNEQNRSWRSSPSLMFEYQRLEREVERTTDLYLQLQRQLETTLMDEVNDAPRITKVDSAVAPRKAEWPQFGVLLVSSILTGLVLGFLVAGAAAVIADWRARNPAAAEYLSATFRSVKQDIRGTLRRAT